MDQESILEGKLTGPASIWDVGGNWSMWVVPLTKIGKTGSCWGVWGWEGGDTVWGKTIKRSILDMWSSRCQPDIQSKDVKQGDGFSNVEFRRKVWVPDQTFESYLSNDNIQGNESGQSSTGEKYRQRRGLNTEH